MAFKKIEITSVSQLLEEIKKLETGRWIFRGVCDEEYELLPSIGRIRHKSVQEKIDSKEEEIFFRSFIDKVRPYINLTIENDLEWMVVAQHHGLPTRLLDWTSSPIIAAYFAATKIEDRIVVSTTGEVTQNPINGAIYAVKAPAKVETADSQNPFKINCIKFFEPPHVSERVPRQVSIFTIHNAPQQAWQPNEGYMFTIPRAKKFAIKKELNRLGINQASRFPGIDATAAYIGWQLKWGPALAE